MYCVSDGEQLTVMSGFLSCTRPLPFSELWTCRTLRKKNGAL